MARIIGFESFHKIKEVEIKEKKIQEEIEELEKKIGLEDEPLLVLSDETAMTVGNYLLDARENINRVLNILGIDEISDLSEIGGD